MPASSASAPNQTAELCRQLARDLRAPRAPAGLGTVHAPRVRRVSALAAGAVLLIGLNAGALAAPARDGRDSKAILGRSGIAAVHFGLPMAQAVADLTARFGRPVAHGVNTGCGSRYTEVVWGDLAVEFRSHRFSGYRYLVGGYPLTTPGSPRARPPKTITPRLATATGITLGSTLSQLRAAYRSLTRVGADSWRAPNGLLFADTADRDPVPASAAIVEIKIGTCGAF